MGAADDLVTIEDHLRWAAEEFARHDLWFGHGTDNAWDEAAALVTGALGLAPDRLRNVLQTRATAGQRLLLTSLVTRRVVERVPVPYLVGDAWFAGRPFTVDASVLIPRSPIAELIERRFSPWLPEVPQRILDLCTGSGCIGIACALEFPGTRVVLSDLSEDALGIARRNVVRHRVGDRVQVVRSDLFAALANERFDLIVCNPPYVDADDFANLPAEYRHEPALALAAGEDGLDIVRRLIHDAPDHLTRGGTLIVEVGNSARAMLDAYPTLPFIWPDFEHGAGGVFVLEAASLS